MWQLGSKHGTQMRNYIWLELPLKIPHVTYKVHAFVCVCVYTPVICMYITKSTSYTVKYCIIYF
jgi:hypothetical protein